MQADPSTACWRRARRKDSALDLCRARRRDDDVDGTLGRRARSVVQRSVRARRGAPLARTWSSWTRAPCSTAAAPALLDAVAPRRCSWLRAARDHGPATGPAQRAPRRAADLARGRRRRCSCGTSSGRRSRAARARAAHASTRGDGRLEGPSSGGGDAGGVGRRVRPVDRRHACRALASSTVEVGGLGERGLRVDHDRGRLPAATRARESLFARVRARAGGPRPAARRAVLTSSAAGRRPQRGSTRLLQARLNRPARGKAETRVGDVMLREGASRCSSATTHQARVHAALDSTVPSRGRRGGRRLNQFGCRRVQSRRPGERWRSLHAFAEGGFSRRASSSRPPADTVARASKASACGVGRRTAARAFCAGGAHGTKRQDARSTARVALDAARQRDLETHQGAARLGGHRGERAKRRLIAARRPARCASRRGDGRRNDRRTALGAAPGAAASPEAPACPALARGARAA